MEFIKPYTVPPDDPDYDPAADLQVSLGTADEHAALVRAASNLHHRVRRLEALAEKNQTAKFFKPLPGTQENFVRCQAPQAEMEGPPGSGKSMGLILAALHFLDRHGPDARVLIAVPGLIPFSGAWTALNALAPALKVAGLLHHCTPTFEVVMKNGAITFIEASAPWRDDDGAELPVKLQGLQIRFLGVDRIEKIPPANFEYLKSRLRGHQGEAVFLRLTRNKEP